MDSGGAIYTVVNPAQSVQQIELPLLSRQQNPLRDGRIIFRDAGFAPALRGDDVTLGPGELAAVGFGRYSSAEFDLGVQDDVRIPRSIAAVEATFVSGEGNSIQATFAPPAKGDLRIIFQQRGADGRIMRSWPGGPPNGISVGKVLKISAEQEGKELPVKINYDKQVWSGLSWGAGEIKHQDLGGKQGPITVRCSSAEKEPVKLEGRIYAVVY
jgi:hypothetical protein